MECYVQGVVSTLYLKSMILFLTGTLTASVLGMGSILLTKQWEDRTGRVLFAGQRPRLQMAVREAKVWLLHTLPTRSKRAARITGRSVRHMARHALAFGILWIEQKLEQVLQAIRHTAQVPQGQLAASPFLREVAEYKKTLMRRAPTRRQIAQMVEE